VKLALVHDWLTNYAGSEHVILAMHDLWPEAPIYTSLYAPEAMPPEFGPDRLDVRTSFLQRVPGATRRWRHLLPFMPAAFESFDLSDADVVLSSSHACAKGVLTRADCCHICYCYTPIRYVWEMPHQYLAEAGGLKRRLLQPVLRCVRLWDYCAAQRVDRFIAISEAVRQRIAKHYRRDAAVIHPPVDTRLFTPAETRSDRYLVVSRLVGYKRIDLAIAACSQLGRPLDVIGVGPEEERLRRLAGPTISFLGQLSDEEVRRHYAGARGFLFCGEEDFGLTPVEAQATGCPVVAYGRGGATETVVDGDTGVLFTEQSPEAVVGAMERFEQGEWSSERCVANARRFDLSVFREKLTAFVEQAVAEHPERLRQEAR